MVFAANFKRACNFFKIMNGTLSMPLIPKVSHRHTAGTAVGYEKSTRKDTERHLPTISFRTVLMSPAGQEIYPSLLAPE